MQDKIRFKEVCSSNSNDPRIVSSSNRACAIALQSFPLVSHQWCVEHKHDSTTCLIFHLFDTIDGSVTDDSGGLKRPVNSPECLFVVIIRLSHRCLSRY